MFKSFFSTAAIALALSLNPVIAFAQSETEVQATTLSAEKIALITELRTLTFRDENSTQILDLMIKQIQDQAVSMGSGFFGEETDPAMVDSISESVTRVTNRMYELMNEKIDFVTLQREIDFKLYDEYFTEAELQDLIDFYQTPTGEKTAAIQPEMTQRSMELFSEQLTPAMMEITQQVMLDEFASAFEMFGNFEDMETGDAEGWELIEETDPESEMDHGMDHMTGEMDHEMDHMTGEMDHEMDHMTGEMDHEMDHMTGEMDHEDLDAADLDDEDDMDNEPVEEVEETEAM